jgi:hypothetical protein
VATAAAPRTLWSFLGITPSNMAACKAKLCASQIGQLLNSGTGVLGGVTGGIIPPLCPPVPNAAQMAAIAAQGGPGGPAAVAAKIKADEANAAARVAAVEYLGTVDCHFWPDAADALIAALRTDRNECVRYAAAQVLNSGCCCTKKTVEALNITVSGTETDGNPAETSVRVMAAAFSALQNCLCRVPIVPEAPKPPERPEAPPPVPSPMRPEAPVILETPGRTTAVPGATKADGSTVQLSAYYSRLEERSFADVANDARQTLYRISAQRAQGPTILPTGNRSVLHALTKARTVRTAPAAPSNPVPVVAQAGGAGGDLNLATTSGSARRPPVKDDTITPASVNPDVTAPSNPSGKRTLFQIFSNAWNPATDR